MIFNPLHIPLILYGGAAGPLPRAGSGLHKAGNFSAEGSLTAGLRRGQSATPRHHLWSSRGYISRAGGRKGGCSVQTPPDGPVCRQEFISLTPEPHLCLPQNGFKQRLFLAALAPTKCESRRRVFLPIRTNCKQLDHICKKSWSPQGHRTRLCKALSCPGTPFSLCGEDPPSPGFPPTSLTTRLSPPSLLLTPTYNTDASWTQILTPLLSPGSPPW